MRSYADVIRQESVEEVGEKSPAKWVQLSFRFSGEELPWKKIPFSMDLARSWAASCGLMRGGGRMECHDGDLSLEMVVRDESAASLPVRSRREVEDDRQDEEESHCGQLDAGGPGRIQFSNSRAVDNLIGGPLRDRESDDHDGRPARPEVGRPTEQVQFAEHGSRQGHQSVEGDGVPTDLGHVEARGCFNEARDQFKQMPQIRSEDPDRRAERPAVGTVR